MMTIIIMLSC